MKEKKSYGTGKVVFLSFLCVILVVVVSALLLVCITVHRHVYYDDVTSAASAMPLHTTRVTDGSGQTLSLAQYINDTYVQNDRITEAQMSQILRDGDFNLWFGETAGSYQSYLANGKQDPAAAFPEITSAAFAALIERNESTIRLHSGLSDISALNEQTCHNLEMPLAAYNSRMHSVLDSVLLHAAISKWIWFVLGGLLLLLFVWLTAIHIRGERHVGTAIKTFSITAGIPCLALFLWGAVCIWSFGLMQADYLQEPARLLRSTWLTVGGLGSLGCAALFGFGVIWNQIAAKSSVSSAAAPDAYADRNGSNVVKADMEHKSQPTASASEPDKITRHYCRFCGEPLVNSDAKFCYKCGTTQETINPQNTEQKV